MSSKQKTILRSAGMVGDEDPAKLWGMPSYLINRIAHRYNQNVYGQLKALGLTTLNSRIIVVLKLYGEQTVNELCIHAVAEQPAMSRALDRLEEGGYVSRIVSEADNRVRVVRLLPKGEQLYEQIYPVMQKGNEDLLSALSDDQQEQLMELLAGMLKSIRRNPV